MEKLIGGSILFFVVSLIVLYLSEEIGDWRNFIENIGISITISILFFIAGYGLIMILK